MPAQRFRRRRRTAAPRRRTRPNRRFRRTRHVSVYQERKTIDITNERMPYDTGPIVAILSQLVQGVTDEQRIGAAVMWTSIQGKFTVRIGTSGNAQVRLMVVQDLMPDQAIITAAGVLKVPETPMVSAMNLNNNHRFRVLWQRFVTVTAAGPSGIKQVTFYKKLRMRSRYSGPEYNINRITSGSLFLLLLSPQVQGDQGTVRFFVRQRFIG